MRKLQIVQSVNVTSKKCKDGDGDDDVCFYLRENYDRAIGATRAYCTLFRTFLGFYTTGEIPDRTETCIQAETTPIEVPN